MKTSRRRILQVGLAATFLTRISPSAAYADVSQALPAAVVAKPALATCWATQHSARPRVALTRTPAGAAGALRAVGGVISGTQINFTGAGGTLTDWDLKGYQVNVNGNGTWVFNDCLLGLNGVTEVYTLLVASSGSPSVTFNFCKFVLAAHHVDWGGAVVLPGAQKTTFNDCSFLDGNAIAVYMLSDADFNRCYHNATGKNCSADAHLELLKANNCTINTVDCLFDGRDGVLHTPGVNGGMSGLNFCSADKAPLAWTATRCIYINALGMGATYTMQVGRTGASASSFTAIDCAISKGKSSWLGVSGGATYTATRCIDWDTLRNVR